MIGVKGSNDCLAQFNDFKLGNKHAYMIFKIKGSDINVEISVKKADAPKEEDEYAKEFIAAIKKSGQPRYAVLDYNHKVCFVSWVPDTGKAQNKMIYASAKETFISELVGITAKVQATDDGELSLEIIQEKCKKSKKNQK